MMIARMWRICFAAEGLIDGLAKCLPHFLLEATVHRHALRFRLPVLLQCLDGIYAQHGRGAQKLRFGNEGLTALGTGFLDGL